MNYTAGFMPAFCLSAKYRFEIPLSCSDRLDVEVPDEDIKYCRTYKCGQGRAEPDALYSQMEKGQEDTDRFLLVPGKDQRERKPVDIGLEDISKRDSDPDRRVCVVALTAVEEAGYAFDVSEFKLVEAVLAACKRKDDSILWSFFCKLRVVVAA